MKCWTPLGLNKTLPLILCMWLAPVNEEAILTAHCIYLVGKRTAPHTAVRFLFSWAAASFLDPPLQLWDKVKDLAAFCPGTVVPGHSCLSRSELRGHGLSFGKLCFLHSQYLLEADKSILLAGRKRCGIRAVWSALGNWSQSRLGLLKGSVKPCIWPSCQWGTSEEKEDRLVCSLWSVSLGGWAAVIWNSCKCDLNTAEVFDWSVSPSGWLLSAVLRQGEMVQSGEGIPGQQWTQKKGSKTQLTTLTYIMRYFVACF